MRNVLVVLAKLEFWIVLALVGVSVASQNFLIWAVAGIVLYIPIRRIGQGRWSVHTAADFAILGLMVMSIIALLVTPLMEVSLPQVLRLWSGIGLFYAVVNMDGKKGMRWMVLLLCLIGLGLVAVAPAAVSWPVAKLAFLKFNPLAKFPLRMADTIHPNVLGGYLAFFIPIPLAVVGLGWRKLPWWESIFYLASALLMGAMLLLTQSRGALLALGLGLLFMVVLLWRWGWILIALVGALMAGMVLRLGVFQFGQAVINAGGGLSSLQGRVEIWQKALWLIQSYPFSGSGMGLYGKLVDTFLPLLGSEAGSAPHAHNIFLQVAVDLGVPGLVAWLAVFLFVLRSAWQVFRQEKKLSWLAGLSLGIVVSQVVLALDGLTDAVTWGMVRPAPLVWLVWGLAFAAQRMTLPAQHFEE